MFNNTRTSSAGRVRITAIDCVLILLVLAGIFWFGYTVKTELDYEWSWHVIPQYLFRFDADSGGYVPNLLMQGFFTTIRLSVWSMLLAVGTGLVGALMRVSRSPFRRMCAGAYVGLIRNMPPLVLVFLFFYFISDLILAAVHLEEMVRSRSEFTRSAVTFLFAPPQHISVFMSAMLTLALYEGAYVTEIFRAGINAVGSGQWDAGKALGMTRPQLFRYVVIPQSLPTILPPLAGQLVSTIKDSAIVSVIAVQELTFQGMELVAATYLTFEVWITITLMYFVLTFTCAQLVRWVERRVRG